MPFRECTLRSSKQNEVCAFLNSSSTHFPLSITPLWPGFAKFVKKYICISIQDITYRKVSSRSTSPLVAYPMILDCSWSGNLMLMFGQKGPKLNSSRVYCSSLNGISYEKTHWLIIKILSIFKSAKTHETLAFLSHILLASAGVCSHSWAKFKIVLVRKPGRKLYYFMAKFQGSGFLPIFESIYQGSGFFYSNFSISKIQSSMVFPSNFRIQFFKVVVFPSNFWNTTTIWRFFRVNLNFAQERYYLNNKVGVVDFANAQGLVMFFCQRAQRLL